MEKEETKKTVLTPEQIVEKTSIADVYRAAKQLDGITRPTDLIYSEYFSKISSNV